MGGGGSSETRGYGSLPFWAEGAHRSLINKAENFAYGDRGAYVPYGDQRISGLSSPEMAALGARQDLYNRGDPASAFASNQLGLSADFAKQMGEAANRQFDTAELQRRMNPYLDNVINPQLREASQEYDRNLYKSQADSIARGGAVGSYRAGLQDTLLRGQKAESLADIRGKGQYEAFNAAQDSFFRDRDSVISGLSAAGQTASGLAGASSQLGFDAQQRQLTNIAELERSGAIQRELRQREMDLAYRDFEQERDWPIQRMSFLSSILSGVPYAQLGSQSTNIPQPGLPSQLASLGLGAAGLSQLFGTVGS